MLLYTANHYSAVPPSAHPEPARRPGKVCDQKSKWKVRKIMVDTVLIEQTEKNIKLAEDIVLTALSCSIAAGLGDVSLTRARRGLCISMPLVAPFIRRSFLHQLREASAEIWTRHPWTKTATPGVSSRLERYDNNANEINV